MSKSQNVFVHIMKYSPSVWIAKNFFSDLHSQLLPSHLSLQEDSPHFNPFNVFVQNCKICLSKLQRNLHSQLLPSLHSLQEYSPHTSKYLDLPFLTLLSLLRAFLRPWIYTDISKYKDIYCEVEIPWYFCCISKSKKLIPIQN